MGTEEHPIDDYQGIGIIEDFVSLSIYAQSTGEDKGQFNVYVNKEYASGIRMTEDLTINGGQVTANGGQYGILSYYEDIILGWTNPTDFIYANSYDFLYPDFYTVIVKEGKTFIDEDGNTYESGTVSASAINGKTLRPNIAPSTVTQTIELAEGWNWVSTYIAADDPVGLLDMFKAGLGDNATEIQSYGYATEYEGDEEWFGDLDEKGLENEQMYLINVVNACSVTLEGMPAAPEEYEITINPGWNWIGFPSSEAIEVNVALADFEAEEGDEIQSKDYATEFDGEDWFGDLEEFIPGQGYMYFSASEEVKTLVFSTGAKAKGKTR